MTHLSLFSGIGGIDIAAEWAGFKTVAFVERDPFCQKWLAKHWPGVPCYDDITAFDARPFRGVHLVSGGFPCQPFSHAGKRRGKDDDRFLWPEMLRVVRESRPAWVLGENVAGFVGLGLDGCLADLEAQGYEARAFVLPACAVYAPHRRERCFIVAHCGGAADVADAERLRLGAELWEPEGQQHGGRRAARGFAEAYDFWAVEPSVGRVVDGIPGGLVEPQLRALGNAVVPQQVYPVLQAIADCIQGGQ